ncbi:MAG: ceramidase domain-containing protein [Chromatiales bacterium]|nr:ceramidase domain-containing protein [Chromatiales bacterium]
MATMDQTLAVVLFIVFNAVTLLAGIIWLIWRDTQGRPWWKHAGMLTGLVLTLLCAVLLGIGMGSQWQGMELNGCIAAGKCYCENLPLLGTPMAIAQPVSTLTAFAPIISGLLILGWADIDRLSGRRDGNPMKTGSVYALLFGSIVLLLGPGSMAFHVSMTEVISRFDPLSISLFAIFAALYGIWRASLADATRWGLIVFLLGFALLVAAALVAIFVFGLTDEVSMATLVVLVIVELVLIIATAAGGINRLRRNFGYFFAILVGFGLAFFLWFASETGRSLCVTDSFWQGHGGWHLLAMGLVPFLFFLHFRAESRP